MWEFLRCVSQDGSYCYTVHSQLYSNPFATYYALLCWQHSATDILYLEATFLSWKRSGTGIYYPILAHIWCRITWSYLHQAYASICSVDKVLRTVTLSPALLTRLYRISYLISHLDIGGPLSCLADRCVTPSPCTLPSLSFIEKKHGWGIMVSCFEGLLTNFYIPYFFVPRNYISSSQLSMFPSGHI